MVNSIERVKLNLHSYYSLLSRVLVCYASADMCINLNFYFLNEYLSIMQNASVDGAKIPLIPVFFAVVSIIESDLVNSGGVGLGSCLLVFTGSYLLIALVTLAFTKRYSYFSLL